MYLYIYCLIYLFHNHINVFHRLIDLIKLYFRPFNIASNGIPYFDLLCQMKSEGLAEISLFSIIIVGCCKKSCFGIQTEVICLDAGINGFTQRYSPLDPFKKMELGHADTLFFIRRARSRGREHGHANGSEFTYLY